MIKLKMPFLQGFNQIVSGGNCCELFGNAQLGWDTSCDFLYVPAAKGIHLQHMLKGYHVVI